jgi:branched-subunit amino acid aminotransferase/4-amino-4-deoxychorismate lyase
LKEHMQRFLNSAKIYRMDHSWTLDQLCAASVESMLYPSHLVPQPR